MDLIVNNEVITKDKKEEAVAGLLKELNEELHKNLEEKKVDKNQYDFIDLSERYKNDYWEFRIGHMEDDIASTIGLSKSTYEELLIYGSLNKAIDESIFELANREGVTLYRKEFGANWSIDDKVYNVDKYEINGREVKHEKVETKSTLQKYKNKDIIFQYDEKNHVIVRDDLKQEAIYKACEKCMKYKNQQDKEVAKYKIEGHMYQTIGCMPISYLGDVETQDEFEDIDFVNDIYDDSTSVYQVQNGEYVKIYDGYFEDAIFVGEIVGTVDDNSLEYYVNKELNLSKSIDRANLDKTISKLINNTVSEFSKNNNITIYMKEANGHKVNNEYVYNVYKYENGNKKKLEINEKDIPRKWWDNNLIYQYNDKGEIVARFDLYEEIKQIAVKNSKLINKKEILDNQNFINKLGKKYNINSEDLIKLNNKIEKFLKDVCVNFKKITYIGYDKEKNKFYEIEYDENGIKRKNTNDDYLKQFIGNFHAHFKDIPLMNRSANFLRKDIDSTIRKYLKENNNIDGLNFSELEKKYNDSKYIKKLSDN